jgi:hypothetical protein
MKKKYQAEGLPFIFHIDQNLKPTPIIKMKKPFFGKIPRAVNRKNLRLIMQNI